MLEKLVSASARPVNAATGATGVLSAVFGLMTAFDVGITERQETAIILAVSVIGFYLVGITGSKTLGKIIGDPEIPSIEPGAPVPVTQLPSTLTTAPAPEPGGDRTTRDPEGPWT